MFLRILSYCMIAGALLTGCASTSNIAGNATEPLVHANTGYILASVVSRNESYDPELKLGGTATVSAYFYPVSRPEKMEFSADGGGFASKPYNTVPELEGIRTIVWRAVKPGKYKLGKVYANWISYNKSITWEPVDSPAIEVREGEVVYVGSAQVVSYAGKSLLFGLAVPASSKITFSDNYQKDFLLIKSLDPRIKDFKVVNGMSGQLLD